ncbi:hypothetical protein [Legionella sp. W05-934-2]|jgi:hypothetical protein|uniref:hypothetical protein n=1 Tax=Legionella sp. W05-934-2 TaxID=1198649 RepID=UPI0034623FA0
MEIEPLQPVAVFLSIDEEEHVVCHLVDITKDQIRVICNEYLEKSTPVDFQSQFFIGHAIINGVKFDKKIFTYTLDIKNIRYKPGLIINEKL